MMPNPYASPEQDSAIAPTSDHDQFILQEATPLLREEERALWTAFLIKAPSLLMQILFMGIVMLFFIKHYLVLVTDQRIIMIRTGLGLLKPTKQNRGVESIEWNTVRAVTLGGLANNRSIDLFFVDGTKRTLRIAPWSKFVTGQKDFFAFLQTFEARQGEVARPS